jgi:phosphocarrier protein
VSEVFVSANGRRANAKSILDILALGAEGGVELLIDASGDDAAEAAEQLALLVPALA